jgi:pilus assembly protein CpaE
MQPLTFVTYSSDRTSSKELGEALGACGRARLLADSKSTEEMRADVLRLQPSAAVIVLGPEKSEREFALIKKLVESSPATALIVAARDASTALILSSLRAGAREFLQLPIDEAELKTVLDRTAEFSAAAVVAAEAQGRKKSGRIIAAFSTKGGSGISFLATNLASVIGEDTLLIDLNLQAGDADSFLGLEARYSFADLVRNRARLDDTLIGNYITPHSARLSLLAAPREAHEAEDIQPEHVAEVLHMLRQKYEYLVLDLQHTLDPLTVTALDQADDIVLVLTLDIPGIRSTKRALKIFDRIGYPRKKIHVVVNRWSKQIEVELQKVELHLGEHLIGFIPNDYRKVMDSINLGQPLVQTDPSSKITLEIRRLAALIAGKQIVAPQERKGLLKSVFGRGNGPTSTLDLSARLDKA